MVFNPSLTNTHVCNSCGVTWLFLMYSRRITDVVFFRIGSSADKMTASWKTRLIIPLPCFRSRHGFSPSSRTYGSKMFQTFAFRFSFELVIDLKYQGEGLLRAGNALKPSSSKEIETYTSDHIIIKTLINAIGLRWMR